VGGRQWFIDISELVRHDWQSGIQRVVKNYLLELMLHPPQGVTVVPVFASPERIGYFVADKYVLGLAGIEPGEDAGRAIEPRPGDVFFGLDLQPHIVPQQWEFLAGLKRAGVHLAFMVYDLLPIQLPECFSEGALPDHQRWLRTVGGADLLVCISHAVAADVRAWFERQHIDPHPEVAAVHLGADLTHGFASAGLPAAAEELLRQVRAQPSFLMVGTIEPRKAHAQALDAFEQLWAEGDDATLVIAGRPGWMTGPLVERLRNHAERGKRLLWVEDGSDELIERLYRNSTCLLAASRGEGFGLPLIEAAQRALPIIARDLPVFREVAGPHAFYFHGDAPQAIASAVREWRALQRQGAQPRSEGIEWMTWAQSAARLRDGLAAHHWRQPPAA
jgi:glycosyltransferase involved in cell wall biosynthesis